MDNTAVFIDGGFMSKLQKHFGNGAYMKIDHLKFAKLIAKKQGLFCKHIFYYYAPPFQATPPTEAQKKRKEGYDKFKTALSKNKEVTFREGRVQKTTDDDGKDNYKQKGVDTLIVMDMMNLPLHHPEIRRIILMACDSDFVPVIRHLKEHGIEVILATYFAHKRNTNFSRCNELMQSVSSHVLLDISDFDNAIPAYADNK
jgi:uncharacterized LabA/DUF88 family protein